MDVTLGEAKWKVGWSIETAGATPEVSLVDVTFEIVAGRSKSTSVGVELSPRSWGTDRYVVLPGAAYAGNRFESRSQQYPPMFEGVDARA
jgi:hypothetical protein